MCDWRICPVLLQLLGQAHDLRIHTQLNAINGITWTEPCACITHEWGFCAHGNCSGVIRAWWHLVNARIHKPETRKQECFCRNSGFGRVNPELHLPLNTAFMNHITTRLWTRSIHRSQWESWLLPGASHTHINRVKIYCLHTTNRIIHRTPGMAPQDFPADTATSAELLFPVLVAADPRSIFRHKSVFC